MDPNVNSQEIEHTSDVENVVAYRDWSNPEPISDINDSLYIFQEYIEDEWDNISGDIILFI